MSAGRLLRATTTPSEPGQVAIEYLIWEPPAYGCPDALERKLLADIAFGRQRTAYAVLTWCDPKLRPWERMSVEDAALLIVGIYFDGPEHVAPILVARAEAQRAAQRLEVQRIQRRAQMGAIGA